MDVERCALFINPLYLFLKKPVLCGILACLHISRFLSPKNRIFWKNSQRSVTLKKSKYQSTKKRLCRKL